MYYVRLTGTLSLRQYFNKCELRLQGQFAWLCNRYNWLRRELQKGWLKGYLVGNNKGEGGGCSEQHYYLICCGSSFQFFFHFFILILIRCKLYKILSFSFSLSLTSKLELWTIKKNVTKSMCTCDYPYLMGFFWWIQWTLLHKACFFK